MHLELKRLVPTCGMYYHTIVVKNRKLHQFCMLKQFHKKSIFISFTHGSGFTLSKVKTRNKSGFYNHSNSTIKRLCSPLWYIYVHNSTRYAIYHWHHKSLRTPYLIKSFYDRNQVSVQVAETKVKFKHHENLKLVLLNLTGRLNLHLTIQFASDEFVV